MNNLDKNYLKTLDILKEVSKIKKKNQTIVGFCAETNDLEKNAKEFDSASEITEEVVSEDGTTNTGENAEGNTTEEGGTQPQPTQQEEIIHNDPQQPAPVIPNHIPAPAAMRPIDIHQDIAPTLRTIMPQEE